MKHRRCVTCRRWTAVNASALAQSILVRGNDLAARHGIDDGDLRYAAEQAIGTLARSTCLGQLPGVGLKRRLDFRGAREQGDPLGDESLGVGFTAPAGGRGPARW